MVKCGTFACGVYMGVRWERSFLGSPVRVKKEGGGGHGTTIGASKKAIFIIKRQTVARRAKL